MQRPVARASFIADVYQSFPARNRRRVIIRGIALRLGHQPPIGDRVHAATETAGGTNGLVTSKRSPARRQKTGIIICVAVTETPLLSASSNAPSLISSTEISAS